MNNTFRLLILGFIINSCSNDDKADEIVMDSQLLGDWQVVETIDDIITEEEMETGVYWRLVEDGRIVSFKNDGTFNNLAYYCLNGSYTINENKISYKCDEDNAEYLPYHYRIIGDTLTLSGDFVAEKLIRSFSMDSN